MPFIQPRSSSLHSTIIERRRERARNNAFRKREKNHKPLNIINAHFVCSDDDNKFRLFYMAIAKDQIYSCFIYEYETLQMASIYAITMYCILIYAIRGGFEVKVSIYYKS